MKTALLIGGTGATGRAIISELLERDYSVSIYNRGRHNDSLDIGDLEYITGDPHFRDQIARDLGTREWDVTVATYGRTRYLADALRHRTGQLVAVSGMPVVQSYPGMPVREGDPIVDVRDAPAAMRGLVPKIAQTERSILSGTDEGYYSSSVVRYPYVYGPHSVVPMEWHVIKRCLDGRSRWALHDGGLAIIGRCASANAARLIANIIDNPEVSRGKLYHAADSRQYSQREWIEIVAAAIGHEFEFVDIPPSIAPLGVSSVPMAGELLFSSNEADLLHGVLRHEVPTAELARETLGYADAVNPAEWIAETVDYWLRNPPVVDGLAGRLSPLDFDYDAEDILLDWWGKILGTRPTSGVPVERSHAYEHPKASMKGSS